MTCVTTDAPAHRAADADRVSCFFAMLRLAASVLLLAITMGGCIFFANGTEALDAGPEMDAGAGVDHGVADAGWGDGNWTQCTSPVVEGLAVCGGPFHCSATSAACSGCGDCLFNDPGCTAQDPLNTCINDGLVAAADGTPARSCPACPDGNICVAMFTGFESFTCAPYDLGVLFAKNGASDRVRYADMGLWTGALLPPPPVTCPSVPDLQFCGGKCGTCPSGQVCAGRSPLHPNSFCVPQGSGPCPIGGNVCPWSPDAGVGCLKFTVQPDAQAVANQWGLCVPTSLCEAAAAGLPGGATCSL